MGTPEGGALITRAAEPHARRRQTASVEPDLVDQLPVGLLVVDVRRRPVRWNRAFGELLGLEGSDVPDPGRIVGDGASADPSAGASALLLGALHDGALTRDAPAVVAQRDGTTRAVSLTVGPLAGAHGEPGGAALIAVDTTERRESETLREVFLGVLSHELRTPVTSIFGGTELLRRDDLPDEVRAELLDDIRSESERLHRLVEDLLVIARVERGAPVAGRDPVLLQHLIPRTVRAEQRHWPASRFALRVERDLPAVEGEDGYIEQVVHNLVSNAAKYGPQDGLVEITAAHADGEVHVHVFDRGPGIPEWAVDDVFRPFYRMPSLGTSPPGAGIGLYVSRAIVQALGGRIWAGPRSGGGADVGFVLRVYPIEGDA